MASQGAATIGIRAHGFGLPRIAAMSAIEEYSIGVEEGE